MMNEIKEIVTILTKYKNKNTAKIINELQNSFMELPEIKEEISQYCKELRDPKEIICHEKKIEFFCKLYSATLDLETFFIDLNEAVTQILKNL